MYEDWIRGQVVEHRGRRLLLLAIDELSRGCLVWRVFDIVNGDTDVITLDLEQSEAASSHSEPADAQRQAPPGKTHGRFVFTLLIVGVFASLGWYYKAAKEKRQLNAASPGAIMEKPDSIVPSEPPIVVVRTPILDLSKRPELPKKPSEKVLGERIDEYRELADGDQAWARKLVRIWGQLNQLDSLRLKPNTLAQSVYIKNSDAIQFLVNQDNIWAIQQQQRMLEDAKINITGSKGPLADSTIAIYGDSLLQLAEQGALSDQQLVNLYVGWSDHLLRKGGDEPIAEAAVYLEKAAELGDKPSSLHLGWLFLKGKGAISVDHEKAATYFYTAAAAGNAEACYYLAKMYLDAQTGDDDTEGSYRRWIDEAANLGNASALNEKGWHHLNGTAGFPTDLDEAEKYFKEAIKRGATVALANLAEVYIERAKSKIRQGKSLSGYEQHLTDAMAVLVTGVEDHGDPSCMGSLAKWLDTYEGLPSIDPWKSPRLDGLLEQDADYADKLRQRGSEIEAQRSGRMFFPTR